jgi:predicted regulator of Ras-like GTPase activity (Roadblock/LC7/MglB family)
MENDVSSFVLRNTLTEITNAYPNIQSIYLFKEDGDFISGEERAQEEAAVHTIDALDEVLEKAKALGGLESISLEGTKGTVNVSRVNDFYLVTVVPEKADLKYISVFTNVLLPTVLKLLDKIAPVLNRNSLSETESEEPRVRPVIKPDEESAEEAAEKHEEHEAAEAGPEKILPEPQVNQFIVENVGGLFASSDTVRIDCDTLSQWTELYEDKKIEEATVETFGGKSVRCKLKPLKNAKLEGKGIIQIPEKIQQTLDTRKGELVRVKPVIE